MNVDFDHGGPQGPDEVLLDFSVNTNPLGRILRCCALGARRHW